MKPEFNTSFIFHCISLGPEKWQSAPAPKNTVIFIRNNGAKGATLHDDSWLAAQIHGKDYEWSLVKK